MGEEAKPGPTVKVFTGDEFVELQTDLLQALNEADVRKTELLRQQEVAELREDVAKSQRVQSGLERQEFVETYHGRGHKAPKRGGPQQALDAIERAREDLDPSLL
ncbi:MAG TPA: hypothetical protein VMW29_02345 [Candidatus Bathyarchaeia archaeon]|nr:hypothetical protein [Candidatus Bathyarchaeia archaeon]